jgi:peptide/nickel transport system substrate-binding protein
MRRRSLLQLASAAALARPAIAAAQAARTLKFIPQADVAVLDPLWTQAHVTRNHSYLVFDTLYGQSSTNEISPQMVEGHVVEDDGKLWTLRLRPGLRFHDNTPVLARDCVASIQRWGKRDIMGRLLLAATAELSAPDDSTIRFRLSRPFPQLPLALGKAGANVCVIMPERLARTDAFTQITEMVGSGPFRFNAAEQVTGARFVYERFDGYKPREGAADFLAGPKVVYFDRVEWLVNPDPGTAAAALQSGEVDWLEQPMLDLVPTLRRNRNIDVQVLDRLGYVGIIRMNQIQPPFNNPAIRRALLHAVKQSDFMRAVVGDDDSLWQDGVGSFCPGTLPANKAGLNTLPPPNIDDARREIAAAGYNNEPVVLLGVSDLPATKAASDVLADLIHKLGFNLDYQVMDWGTVVQRRTKKDAPAKGGWNLFCTFNAGVDQSNPATHAWLSTAGATAAPGWPDSPKLEELRVGWLTAPDQKHVAEEIQLQALQDVPYIPIGQYVYPTAFNRTLTGALKGFPVFWNIRRA